MQVKRLAALWMLAGAMIAALVSQSCSEGPPQPMAANPPMEIIPRESVGKIRAGMKVSDVISAYGESQRRTLNALSYPRLGFAVMPDSEGIVQVVMCGDVTGLDGPLVKAFTGRTPQGIGLGSTRAEVIAAYGEPDQSERFAGGREALKYGSLAMNLSLDRGKVHHIIVRLSGPQEPANAIRVTPVPAQP